MNKYQCPGCGYEYPDGCDVTCQYRHPMTKWKSVYQELPELFEIVWIYWRDQEVLLGCRTADDSEPNECWYSFDYEKCRGTSWWMSNKEAGCDKRSPPGVL